MDYVVKGIIFIPFMTFVYFVTDYFIDILKDAISDIPISGLMCQFGIYQGLSIFFSILVTSFVVKQILNFAK